jgi:ribosomal protein S17
MINTENSKPDINIESLSYDELINLNRKIIERLKFLDSFHTHKEMMQFNLGDNVSFEHSAYGLVFGTLVKFNKKTVTVITENQQKWNVSPRMLKKIKKTKDEIEP